MPPGTSTAIGSMFAYNDSLYYEGAYDASEGALYKLRVKGTLSVQNVDNQAGFTVYPNPTSGSFVLKSETSKLEKVEVLNIAGQIIYEQAVDNRTDVSIHLPAAISNGVYILRATTVDGILQQRLNIQR